jgi:hypothetical protein
MLYQSILSSYCAIYAVANLLELYGARFTPASARSLFKLSTHGASSRPITHSLLSAVVSAQMRIGTLGWHAYRRFSHSLALRAIRPALSQGAPVLMTVRVRHPKWSIRGTHCVIATSADDNGIHLVDSLGRRDGKTPNATIVPEKTSLGWPIAGTRLTVTNGAVRVLTGLPPIDRRWRGT